MFIEGNDQGNDLCDFNFSKGKNFLIVVFQLYSSACLKGLIQLVCLFVFSHEDITLRIELSISEFAHILVLSDRYLLSIISGFIQIDLKCFP